jgi:hypothetical protein
MIARPAMDVRAHVHPTEGVHGSSTLTVEDDVLVGEWKGHTG